MQTKNINIKFIRHGTTLYNEENRVQGGSDIPLSAKGLDEINNIDINKSNYDVKIEGEILSSCPMKGCWMKIRAEKDTILVRFKDYGFFVPKAGIEGDKAIINGKMSIETLSVDLLRHYAEDAGKSKDEIEKITKPEVSLTFLADGIFIENL